MNTDIRDSREIIVVEDDNLDRIDKYLSEKEEDLSRSLIKKMLKEGYIKVNDQRVKANYIVSTGDVVSLQILIVNNHLIEAENIPLDIIYQDDDIIIINKPNGMVVHPGAGAYKGTLVNALMYHFDNLSTLGGNIRAGIVHRIDKETTGLLVVAKNDRAHRILADQLVDKTLNRTYRAIAHGQILDKKVIVDAPIGRDPNNRTKMMITANNSKDAYTEFEVLNVVENFSYLECKLKTGRTHQIRVHLNYIKHPILGDPKYGYRKDDTSFGQYLHAYKLGLIHPTTNEYMEFEAPFPPEFKEKLLELGLE